VGGLNSGIRQNPDTNSSRFYDGVKPIAANIDQINCWWRYVSTTVAHIIDRYLVCAVEVRPNPPVFLVHKRKMELLSERRREYCEEVVEYMKKLATESCYMSFVFTQEGIAEAIPLFKEIKLSVFVGQSELG